LAKGVAVADMRGVVVPNKRKANLFGGEHTKRRLRPPNTVVKWRKISRSKLGGVHVHLRGTILNLIHKL